MLCLSHFIFAILGRGEWFPDAATGWCMSLKSLGICPRDFIDLLL
jgi:hypothetical protein